MKSIAQRITLLFYVALCGASCDIRADLTHCYDNVDYEVDVKFAYTQRDLIFRGIDPNDVESMTLFVFDNQGRFVSRFREDNIAFSDTYIMKISLKPGDYTFVAWGNLEPPYFTLPGEFETGVDKLSAAQLFMQRPTSNFLTGLLPHLFFARLEMGTVVPNEVNTFTLPTKQITNNITLITKGLKPTSNEFEYRIADSNSKYDFAANFAPDTEFRYITILKSVGADTHTGVLNVMKLADGREAILEVYNYTQAHAVYRHDLIDLVKRLESQVTQVDIDWENTHEYVITLTFNADLTVSVTINGWDVITEDLQLP